MAENNLDTPAEIRLSDELFFSQWAEITIDKLHQALDALEIGKLDGALWRSLLFELQKENGNVEKVLIKFLKYGRFVDLGVGRGVTVANLRAVTKKGVPNKRKAKPWYSKTYYTEVGKLKSLFAEKFGQTLPVAIKEQLMAEITLAA